MWNWSWLHSIQEVYGELVEGEPELFYIGFLFDKQWGNTLSAVLTVINITGNRTWPVMNLCKSRRLIVNYACNLSVPVFLCAYFSSVHIL